MSIRIRIIDSVRRVLLPHVSSWVQPCFVIVKLTGPYGGSDNSTYYRAYIYFEKKRIFEGKKKSAKRLNNEMAYDG
ncbi:hypothetical protein FRC03_008618 [Tulasnella sp. 419]|nr:hypothetical protein FRC03_008618 [Tulasnella sp. 419]